MYGPKKGLLASISRQFSLNFLLEFPPDEFSGALSRSQQTASGACREILRRPVEKGLAPLSRSETFEGHERGHSTFCLSFRVRLDSLSWRLAPKPQLGIDHLGGNDLGAGTETTAAHLFGTNGGGILDLLGVRGKAGRAYRELDLFSGQKKRPARVGGRLGDVKSSSRTILLRNLCRYSCGCRDTRDAARRGCTSAHSARTLEGNAPEVAVAAED